MYANKLVTTRRAIENANTAHSQPGYGAGCFQSPSRFPLAFLFHTFVVEGTHGSFKPMERSFCLRSSSSSSSPSRRVADFFVGKLRGWVVSFQIDSVVLGSGLHGVIKHLPATAIVAGGNSRAYLVPFVHVRVKLVCQVNEVVNWSMVGVMWVTVASV
eukprot:1137093-Pelagomonas_calceolata.AAC.1